jgi:hypothetical protein
VLIAAGSDKKAPLPPGEQNAKRFEALFEKYGLKFNKGTVSKLIRDDLRALDKIDKLPAETITKARSLIDAIRKSLSR